MENLAEAGFGADFKISVVMHPAEHRPARRVQGDRRPVRRPAAAHPAAPVGAGRGRVGRAAPAPGAAAAALRLAGRPRRRGADRRLVLPPLGLRRGAARAEPVRRGAGGVPDRPGRRRLRLPVRDPRELPGRQRPLAGRVRRRCGGTRSCSPSCASPQTGGACASCSVFDSCQGGCMAAKFFTGLPLDGPDPECVRGFGEQALAARSADTAIPQLRGRPLPLRAAQQPAAEGAGAADALGAPAAAARPGVRREPAGGVRAPAPGMIDGPGDTGSDTGLVSPTRSCRADWRLGERAWPEIDGRPTLLVPVGSVEQHGPHLPLDTDARVAAAVAARAAAGAGALLVAPPVALRRVGRARGLPRARCRSGTRRCGCCWSSWAGRRPAGRGGWCSSTATAATSRRSSRPSACCATRGATSPGSPARPGGDAHAGRTETSLVLALDPALVRPAAGGGQHRPRSRELLPAMRAGGVAAVSPNGVLGDPAGASAEEGERLLAAMADGADRRPHPLDPRRLRPPPLIRRVRVRRESARFASASRHVRRMNVSTRSFPGHLALSNSRDSRRRHRGTRGAERADSRVGRGGVRGCGPGAGGPTARPGSGRRAGRAGPTGRVRPACGSVPCRPRATATTSPSRSATRGDTGPNQPSATACSLGRTRASSPRTSRHVASTSSAAPGRA